ncbi:acyl-CoA dehydrogenase family protein [Saccharopolyspora sp. NPDC003752]
MTVNDYEALAARFRPVFDRIAAGAAERERRRRLPFEEVGWLREAGFGAVRVPVESGGSGAGLDDLFRLLVELGEADSNLPQLLRPHFLFVEEQLRQPPAAVRDEWLRAVAGGVLFGNAISERESHQVGRSNTTLSERDGRLLLNGTKFYSTGSLLADWITVRAERAPGELVVARVPAGAAGLVQRDDWDGFGQRTTASGTVEFTDVEVDPAHVTVWDRDPGVHTALAQLVLLAALVGVARSAARDAAEFVRDRRRSYSHASAPLPKDDPLVQQVVGKIHSAAFAAQATLEAAVGSVRRALQGSRAEVVAAEVDVSKAQVVIADLVLRAVTEVFDVGGSSVVSQEKLLDRHWRNARTLTVHNPLVYKARAVGDHAINDSLPVFAWTTGSPGPA